MKINLKKSDSGFVLLMSIMLIVFLSILMGAGIFRTDMQLREARQRIDSQNAFYSAESGIDRAVFELRTNIGWRPGENGQPVVEDIPVRSNPNDPATTLGFYTIEVVPWTPVNSRDSVLVRSTGRDALREVRRVIVTQVILINPASFITSSLGDLHLGSGAHLDFDILGKDVYFDINKSIESDEDRKVRIDGDVYYLNPNGLHNQNDSDVSYDNGIKSPAITFAGVDMDRYRSIVSENHGQGYFTGDLDLSGTINMGTIANTNGLVVVEGDINISGEYSESMLFVAGGNIYINGNLQPHQGSNPQKPQIGLLASKDIIIPEEASDDLAIEGFLMADGAPGSEGGVFIAKGADKFKKRNLNFTGSIAIRGNNATTGVDLNVYKNRTYTYNAELSNNRLIPYLPFIANVHSWREVTPENDPFPKPELP